MQWSPDDSVLAVQDLNGTVKVFNHNSVNVHISCCILFQANNESVVFYFKRTMSLLYFISSKQ